MHVDLEKPSDQGWSRAIGKIGGLATMKAERG
jgi:hypothetical protein